MRRNAVISVYDKTNLTNLAIKLIDNNYNIWSSGGTFKYLKKQLRDFRSRYVYKIEDLTKFPEILNGRVKTLHPSIYGGILADLDNKEHCDELITHGLRQFDLVVVNLYPFKKVINNPIHTEMDAIENIDIGGVSLIRAAAKNYKNVSVLVDPSQYINYFENGLNPTNYFKKDLAKIAFHYIANYDIDIASYLDKDHEIIYRKYYTCQDLKYGLNPHQVTAKLASINDNPMPFNIINGSPGYINMIDAIQSWKLVSEIQNVTGLIAVSSFKHTTPTGVALGVPLMENEKEYFNIDSTSSISLPALTFLRARDIDPLSSFGDFIACSTIVDEDFAKKLKPFVSDGIIAKGYEPKALEILAKKKKGKFIILEASPFYKDEEKLECKEFSGLALIESPNTEIIKDDWFIDIPTKNNLIDGFVKNNLIIANILLKYTPSNSIAFSFRGRVVGVGAGQQNRVDCVKLAGKKWLNWLLRRHPKVLEYRKKLESEKKYKKQEIINKLYDYLEFICNNSSLKIPEWLQHYRNGACLASDGFFPFRDNIEVAKDYGVKWIIQPGGSIADSDVISACDENDITMVMTGKRMFYH